MIYHKLTVFILSKGINESSKLSGFIPVEILFVPPPSIGEVGPYSEASEVLLAKFGDWSPNIIVSYLSIPLIGETGLFSIALMSGSCK